MPLTSDTLQPTDTATATPTSQTLRLTLAFGIAQHTLYMFCCFLCMDVVPSILLVRLMHSLLFHSYMYFTCISFYFSIKKRDPEMAKKKGNGYLLERPRTRLPYELAIR